MATSGRALVAGVLVVACASCATASGPSDGPPSAGSPTATIAVTTTAIAQTPSPSGPCIQPVPPAAEAVLEAGWSAKQGPLAWSFMQAIGTTTTRQVGEIQGVGVVRLEPDGRRPLIYAFKNTATDQAGGSYDDQFAAWKETHGFEGLDDFTVRAWSARTGVVTQIGRSGTVDGHPLPSPWADPLIVDGTAFWVQGIDPTGRMELIAVDLTTFQRRVLRVGIIIDIAVFGEDLLLTEFPAPGGDQLVHRIDRRTGAEKPVPAGLASEHSVSMLASDGRSVTWIRRQPSGSSQLMFLPDPQGSARTLIAKGVGGFNPPFTIRDNIVYGAGDEGSFVINGLTGARYVFAEHYGIRATRDTVSIVSRYERKDQQFTVATIPAEQLRPGSC